MADSLIAATSDLPMGLPQYVYQRDLQSVNYCVCSGGPLSPELHSLLQSTTDCRILLA